VVRHLFFPAVLAVAMVGSAVRISARPDHQAQITLRLIDSVRADWCEGDSIWVKSVEARTAVRSDTLRRVVTPWPFSVADSLVYGIVAVPSECTRRLFRLNTKTGRLLFYALPTDMWGYFWDVSVSPTGRYLLYVAMDTLGREAPVVRRWPGGSIVWHGPLRDGCECDVDTHHAHWVTVDSFEVATSIARGQYERVSVSMKVQRAHIDTVTRDLDAWHSPLR
jgi:hypothetical protein